MKKGSKVLCNWVIMAINIAQFLIFCDAMSLPPSLATYSDSRPQADRAAVGGLMALFPDNNAGAVYIFVINEYSGEQLVRQSICNRYMANQMEMTAEYVS